LGFNLHAKPSGLYEISFLFLSAVRSTWLEEMPVLYIQIGETVWGLDSILSEQIVAAEDFFLFHPPDLRSLPPLQARRSMAACHL
jgi:hypothetical protein